MWLGLSGIIGLSLGDSFYFQALISIGSRLGSLLLSLAPIFGALIALTFFGETLTVLQITGIAIELAGIGWVVMSHEELPINPAQSKLSSYIHHKARQVIRRQGSPRRIVWFSVSS